MVKDNEPRRAAMPGIIQKLSKTFRKIFPRPNPQIQRQQVVASPNPNLLESLEVLLASELKHGLNKTLVTKPQKVKSPYTKAPKRVHAVFESKGELSRWPIYRNIERYEGTLARAPLFSRLQDMNKNYAVDETDEEKLTETVAYCRRNLKLATEKETRIK